MRVRTSQTIKAKQTQSNIAIFRRILEPKYAWSIFECVFKQIQYHCKLGWYKGLSECQMMPSGTWGFVRGALGYDVMTQMRRPSTRTPTLWSQPWYSAFISRCWDSVRDFLCKNGLHAQTYCHLTLRNLLPTYPSRLCRIYACDKPVSRQPQTQTNVNLIPPTITYVKVFLIWQFQIVVSM